MTVFRRTTLPALAGFLMILSLALPTRAEPVRRIEHALGVTEIEGTPQRVVTLFQGANDTAVALGVTPVGVVDSWAQQPTYTYLRDDLAGVPHVGLETQPNLEAIAALKPDLIVASRARHEKVYDQLSRIAPTVAEDTVFDFKGTLRLMGDALNRSERADQLLADWDQRAGRLRAALSERLGEAWPLSAAVTNVRNDHLRVYLRESFAGTVLDDLGFAFPDMAAGRTWGVKLNSKESIPAMNADVMFLIFQSDDGAVRENYRAWSGHPLWRRLDAVADDRVYTVDRVDWLLSGGILGANRMMDQINRRFELDG